MSEATDSYRRKIAAQQAAANQTLNIPELKKVVSELVEIATNLCWHVANAEAQAEKASEETEAIKGARASEEERQQLAVQTARATAIRALVKLLPKAIAQAKGSAKTPPRPALLRLILRSLR